MATRENFQKMHMIRIPLHSFVRVLLLAAVMVTGSARAAETVRPAFAGDVGARNLAWPANLVILPLGDSITFGARGTDAGYRGPLYKLLASAGATVHFAGSSTANFGVKTLPQDQWHNEGHGSYAIDDVFKNLDGFDDTIFKRHGGADRDPNGGHWLTGISSGPNARPPLHPDIILLMIGTNERDKPDGAPERLDKLVSKLIDMCPKARLIIARIPPRTTSAADQNFTIGYNRSVDALVAKYAANPRISKVDMHTDFPAGGLSGDKIHPNDIGFNWIAEQWFRAVQAAAASMP